MKIKKNLKILLTIFCLFSFIAQGFFAYSFGVSTYLVQFNSTLLALSEEEKKNGYEFTRLTFYDENDSFTLKRASNLLAVNYNSYKIFSHYLVAGERAELEPSLKVVCNELNKSAEVLKVNGYNDLDYMYEIPLPLYKYNKDKDGNPALWPSYDTRPMNISYGADYTTYVSSDFADNLIEENPETYHDYNDLIGSTYTLSIGTEDSVETVTCSINNIYLSSKTSRWNIDTRDKYLSRYNNFPVDFGKIHKNGIFFSSYDFFLKYGFWYEADIQTTYSNYKFYFENIADKTIKENSLKVFFDIPTHENAEGHKWDNYNDISGILLGKFSLNYLYLALFIVFSIAFLFLYFLLCLGFFSNKFIYYRYRKIFFATPFCIFAVFQICVSLMLFFAKSKYYFVNNYLGNILILISILFSWLIYLIVRIRITKRK